ncbi:MAG: peptidoglycan-binding protein [Gammaproteobacteria bacterium]|nr:peptidoglycan-binding protein [Gammaproteobacteria bacterium]
MNPVIQSINYRFSPDKQTRALCENIISELTGNGIPLSAITAEDVSAEQATITTVFNWSIKVSLKHRRLETEAGKNTLLHKSAAEAQNAAKKQGQQIISSASAKIELIQNINDDPEHYFRHSIIKLNGGKAHAFKQPCSNHCQQGQLTCSRCDGRGTKKATTKKDDLLGTNLGFDSSNICTQCGGKGSTDCPACSGSGEHTHVYEIEAIANRQHKDLVYTDKPKVKALISGFVSQHAHKELLKNYLSPVVIKLEDIDETHCSVIYQSKTQYSLLKLSVFDKFYEILAFGDKLQCISTPTILNDTLLTTVTGIIASKPGKQTALKLAKLQSLTLLKPLIIANDNRTEKELEALLYNNANQLLSPQVTASIVKHITSLKAALIPKYSAVAWSAFVFAGSLSALYAGLSIHPASETLLIVGSHLVTVLGLGYLSSKALTNRHRKKHQQKLEADRREWLPMTIAAVLVSAAFMSASLLTIEQRWQHYFRLQQLISITLKPASTDNRILSNAGLIQLAQNYLIELDYKNINADGIYDTETEYAVKDFQKKFSLPVTSYLDQTTMDLLTKYVIVKKKRFNNELLQ